MSLRNLRNFHLFEEKISNSFTQNEKLSLKNYKFNLNKTIFHLKGHFYSNKYSVLI